MLRYLDNDQNAAGHINENYAREIMELHTLGVGSGYTQKDVQELARILTGVGVDTAPDAPRLKPAYQPLYVRAGLFEFNPNRHDFGDKLFLGHTIKGAGFAEVEQALDILARQPATARHVSLQIAAYFVGDDPPPALVERMARTFERSDGDIAAVLRTLFASPRIPGLAGRGVQGPGALRDLGRAPGLRRPGDPQHRTPAGLAGADGRGAVQSRDAGRLSDSLGGLGRTGRDGRALRHRQADRLRLGRPVQARRPGRGRPAGVPATAERPLLPGPAPDLERPDPRRPGPGGLAAGVERPLPVVARIHATGDRHASPRPLAPRRRRSRPGRRPRLVRAPEPRRLLVVFLRGAYDAANVVIPISSDFYYQARPTLRIARPNPADPNAALALDADWGLHPALKDSLYPLWQARQLAFVPFAGTDDMSRSHFETQDTIELGQPLQGPRDYGSGFMSRLAGQLAGVQPIAFTDQPPMIFRGVQPIPNIGLGGVGKPGVDDRQTRLIEQMYRGQALDRSIAEGFQVRDEVYRSIAAEMTAANRGAVSPKGFELSARRIGRLMRDHYNLAFVDVGGWDTHVNQGAATGYLAGRLPP